MTTSSLAVRVSLLVAGCSLALVSFCLPSLTHAQDDSRREVTITAREGAFHPARLEVRQNDLVKVTFTAEGGAHTFNVDAYRIAKRARPGHPAVFEFRADRVGTFPFYCNLSEAGGTHDMRGELVVRER